MSGSRAILLRLSVQDADVVRQQLTAMGTAGEQALAKLDAAAKNTAGGAGGSGGFGGLRAAVGQAGFQLQDFAVQVQGGTSALTALSQQGSQFLGIFGPTGAIAGAVLTVGILAANLLDLGGNTERAAEAEKKFADAISRTNAFLQTAIQRTNALSIARRGEAVSELQGDLDAQRARLRDVLDEAARLRGDNRSPDAGAFTNDPTLPADRQRLALLRAQEGLIRGRITTLEERLTQVAEGASGAETDQAEALRRTLNDRYRIRREYEERVAELRQLSTRGLFTQAQLERAEADAARKRDEELRSLARREAGPQGRAPRTFEEAEYLAREAATKALREGAARQTRDVEEDFARAAKQIERTEDITRQLGLTFNSAFEEMIGKGARFSDVLKAIEQDISRLIIRQAITTPIGNALNSLIQPLAGGVQDYVGGLFPSSEIVGAAGATKSISFGGARAAGGPVSPGSWYMVGENGPEPFIPSTSGTILPNGSVGGATFAPTYNIDARGADASMLPRLRVEMAAIAQASVAQFAQEINRGGSAARLVGRR